MTSRQRKQPSTANAAASPLSAKNAPRIAHEYLEAVKGTSPREHHEESTVETTNNATRPRRTIKIRFPFLLLVLFLIVLALGVGSYWFSIVETLQLQLASNSNGKSDHHEGNEISTIIDKLTIVENRMASIQDALRNNDEKVIGREELQKLQNVVIQAVAEREDRQAEEMAVSLRERLDSAGQQDLWNDGRKVDWMRGLTKSLVAIQLAESKISHYEMFVKPSWNRLVFEPHTSKVVADLFIACHPDACGVIDKGCREIGRNVTREVLMRRSENELLCLYAPVPEKENEAYRFAHSLNFLAMEPLTSIVALNHYDYILRSDADAVFFPGLLSVVPTGDGWFGAGYYGSALTNHLVQRYTHRLLPQLGQPLRPDETTPSMQSTFYVRKTKFRPFVSVLLTATKTLHDKAFTKEICDEISQLEMSKKLYPGDNSSFCRWPDWHQGVSSLYGTRIAVDYVIENATVTKSLDAMATDLERRDVSTTIQAHMLHLKHIVSNTLGKGASGLCAHPLRTLRRYQKLEGDEEKFADAMEDVYRDSKKESMDSLHYAAAVVFGHFHAIQCHDDNDTSRG